MKLLFAREVERPSSRAARCRLFRVERRRHLKRSEPATGSDTARIKRNAGARRRLLQILIEHGERDGSGLTSKPSLSRPYPVSSTMKAKEIKEP